jgi:hypothetical protein
MNVMGRQFPGHRKRPVGNTYFRYATLQLATLAKPITLATAESVSFNPAIFNPENYLV